MKSIAQIQSNMAHAYGTSQYIKHWTNALVFTDGVNQLREDADCHWLIDAIASYKRTEEFQLWELVVNPDKSAVLTMKEDSDRKPKVIQAIPYTNFPLEKIKFYNEIGGYGTEDNWTTCMVLMLPSER